MSNDIQPEIRFPGFTEEWEARKLSDLMSFSNGINAPKENYGKGRKMISVMDILDEQPIQYASIRNSVEVDKKVELKNKVENGDLVFVRSSEISEEVGWAKAYLEEEYALYSGFSIRGKKIKEFNPHFVELSLNSVNRKQIERKAGGSTRFNVSQTVMNSLEILMPKIEEQNKIDWIFKQIDDTIALQQRKLDLLKEMKKGFLQKMFPKNGAKVPEIRFPGFTEDWEQRKLSELAEVKTGFPFKNEDFIDGGDYLVITNGNIQNNSALVDGNIGNRISAVSEEVKDKYLLNYGDILVTMDGTVGRTAKVFEKKQILAQRVGRLVANGTPEFLYQWLNTGKFFGDMTKVSHGGTIKHISLSEIGDFTAFVPVNEDERVKIGSLLLNIDKTITLQQRKLDLLKETKKGFLQKMFV